MIQIQIISFVNISSIKAQLIIRHKRQMDLRLKTQQTDEGRLGPNDEQEKM